MTKDSTAAPEFPPGPDFVLRAKDALAPITIARWIVEALDINMPMFQRDDSVPVIPPHKIARAARHLADILDYQAAHGSRLPD
jgi:hypothetical protein